MAVVSFEDKTGKAGPYLTTSLIDGATDKLYKTGKFTLLERDRIEHVMKEQKLGLSGLIDSGTAAQIGKMLGADAVLIGTIVNFGESLQENTLGGVRPSNDQFGLGGISINKLNLFIELTLRIVDVESGEIVFSSSGSESFKKTTYGLTVIHEGEQLHFGRRLSDSTLGRKIASKALGEAVEKVLFHPFRLRSLNTSVVKLQNTSLIIGRGSVHGVEPGDIFRIYGRPESVIDPISGENLGTRRIPLFEDSFKIHTAERNYSVCLLTEPLYIRLLEDELSRLNLSEGEYLEVKIELDDEEKHYNRIIDLFEKGYLKKTVHMIKLYYKNYRSRDYFLDFLMAKCFDKGRAYHAAYKYYDRALSQLVGFYLPGVNRRMHQIRTYLRKH